MKTTDFKRVRAINCIFDIFDLNQNCFLSPLEWSDCKIKFGAENKKGIGSCSIKVTLLDRREYVDITFCGWYRHFDEHFDIKSIMFEYPFDSQRLVSVNNHKINCVWLREEEEAGEDAGVVPAITSHEVELGFENSVKL